MVHWWSDGMIDDRWSLHTIGKKLFAVIRNKLTMIY